jgi:hypothetical protein
MVWSPTYSLAILQCDLVFGQSQGTRIDRGNCPEKDATLDVGCDIIVDASHKTHALY